MQDYTITGEQLQAFRQRLVWEEKSPATSEKYLRDAAAFTAWLDGRAASKAAAGAWKAALLEAKLAPATINVKLAAVNRFLVFLGWPAFRVKPLRIQRRLFREPDRELDRSDYLRLIRTARQQGKKRLAKMNEKTDELSRDEEKMKRIAGRNTAITNTVVLAFDLIMLFASALLYQSGAVGFDGVLIPTLALFSSFGPVIALAALGSTLQNTFAAGNRVLDILDEMPVVEEITGKPEITFSGAKAEHVSFSYGNETILSDVSVTIPENAVVGIVGRSGSGKSTLLKLLMRFWKVQKGSVELSGRSVEEINTKNLRELESFVTQETQLFHDSIKNNLRIAKLSATDEEIEAACKKASVHDFIMTLPKGYDTPVGELGDTLSGGERQRLGLARAFLHDAPFMLLDEPTSNLDSLNEAVILKSLREERTGKTVVLVSHRQSTMRIADTVYSVEHGRMS